MPIVQWLPCFKKKWAKDMNRLFTDKVKDTLGIIPPGIANADCSEMPLYTYQISKT